MSATYSLHAIRYATNQRRTRVENFMYSGAVDAHDGPMPMEFFVWVAVGGGKVILVDGGCSEKVCKARGHEFLRCPTQGLGELGIDATQVTDVIITHLHWDHAGNFEKFPNARFHIQSAEIAHATGECMCQPFLRRPYDVEQVCSFVRLLYGQRVTFHHEHAEIAPGINVMRVGGHTPGLQVVQVSTVRGRVLLASDALHYFENREAQNPFPVLVDVREYLAAWGKLSALAESPQHIVPGHDPQVLKLYPAPSAQLEGIVVRLDVAPLNGA